ncbi:MAG TPA: formate dehydrogenase accessory sulfurtransferase FdhD [Gemmatimonadaceae bacterium]|jgi:formate dehydrogenase accessory protein FdhD|nr:formate dehydrogenase accessory sulfurtransferase FdhD [Gemmatimonadaceae bacterium]
MADRPPSLAPDHPLFGLGYSRPFRTRQFVHLDEDTAAEGSAAVAEEVPVALIYNRRPHVVMMATPADYEDFAVGFTLSEEIVASAAEIRDVTVMPYAQGVEIQLIIPDAAGDVLAGRSRELIGRTGCGLCGVQTVSEALRPARTVTADWTLSPDALWRAEAALAGRQTINQATGAVHAAAWATPDGELQVVREDVGRHNALDKVTGALARAGTDPAGGFVVMTSRASYELVQKVAVAGVPILATVSRPTGLAVRLADAAGLTLIALLRGHSANVYAHPARVTAERVSPTL